LLTRTADVSSGVRDPGIQSFDQLFQHGDSLSGFPAI
jgi:hypothetical protein